MLYSFLRAKRVETERKTTQLDYELKTIEERLALVQLICAEQDCSSQYLEILANYLLFLKPKNDHSISTPNRMVTINKNETSYEATEEKIKSKGFSLDEPKEVAKTPRPKISITKRDLETMPLLRQLVQQIQIFNEVIPQLSGRNKYTAKKALIEMRKDQYLIKMSYKPPITTNHLCHSTKQPFLWEDTSQFDANGIQIGAFSLMNEDFVRALLENYSALKENSWDDFTSDTKYLLYELEDIADQALARSPEEWRQIFYMKIDCYDNTEIKEKYPNIQFSKSYISRVWRNKIPKRIAEIATEQFLYSCPNIPKKKCGKCGEWKPAHNAFFSYNKKTPDGFYSSCKQCRSKKGGGDKQ